MAARLAILTPFASPLVRGNAITAERIARGLRQRGVDLRLWDLSVVPETAVENHIDRFRPAIVPPSPASPAGPAARRIARRPNVPLLVTATGTDVNHDLGDPDSAPVVRRVLEGAAAISVFDESMAAAIAEALPARGARGGAARRGGARGGHPAERIVRGGAARSLAARRRAAARYGSDRPVPGRPAVGEASAPAAPNAGEPAARAPGPRARL